MQALHLWFTILLAPLVSPYNFPRPPQNLSQPQNIWQVPSIWKMLEFGFPSEAHKQKAISNGNFVVNNGIPIDVQPHYYNKNKLRVFVTVPRFQGGIPYTLATVSDANGPNGPILNAYPNYEAHNVNGDNCDLITSVFRVALTECNQMWVMDAGTVGMEGQCPPQLLLFDLNTDQIIHRFKFTPSLYTARASLFVTPIAVVRDPSPRGSCRRTMLYIADVSNHGLVVYNYQENRAWRIENQFMYPDPNYGTHTVAGESFTLLDGIFGLATDKRNLYFHPLASVTEYAVRLNIIDNSTNFVNAVNAMPGAFRALGRRSSQCAATTTDSLKNVYCVTFNPIEFIVWNVNFPYNTNTFRRIPINPQLLQFVSGMKVVTNHRGLEELWIMSNRFQKLAAGTQNPNEVNFRIVVYPLNTLNVDNLDLHNKLVFKD